MQVWAAYSPVKNSPPDAKAKAAAGSPSHSATTGELDIYQTNCRCAALAESLLVWTECSAPCSALALQRCYEIGRAASATPELLCALVETNPVMLPAVTGM